ALNTGAKIGGFAHNTGEGGLSPYHKRPGGDLIWQIGTGYFGCRNHDGSFNADKFTEKANSDQVKMIEIKLSQGAKPGHGGILPAAKLTAEIAEIRDVPMGHDVVSPPGHTTFNTPVGLLEFVAQLRKLSGGKPVGFKLCIGKKSEFMAIAKAMLETGILPDFITVDGSEGGTGAAPIELTNSVGTPLRDGLNFVHNVLIGIGKREQIRLIAAGKVISAFHMVRAMALGADMINVARAMMFALGCIQSRSCNNNNCPTGVATQDPSRFKYLDIKSKSKRVAEYHRRTIHALKELIECAGLNDPSELRSHHINRRVNGPEVKNYAELYPTVGKECLIKGCDIPANWQSEWEHAHADSWG
ncbi:MAG TPA: FMN-binding glutamate synthase family protein, partial [Aeromonadales bacterium]|nr:FMN-binding glutamate synthase family protein [Aeromonadales bacterium]